MIHVLEAMVLMDEGVDKNVIDTAAIQFGMPMGPVALADQVGLDVGLHVAESLSESLDTPMPPISDDLRRRVDSGKLGKKTGAGFYDWSEGTPRPDADLQTRQVWPDPLVFIVNHEHVLSTRQSTSAKELCQHPAILP